MPQEPEETNAAPPDLNDEGDGPNEYTSPGGPAASLQQDDEVFEDDPGGEGDGPNRNRVGG